MLNLLAGAEVHRLRLEVPSAMLRVMRRLMRRCHQFVLSSFISRVGITGMSLLGIIRKVLGLPQPLIRGIVAILLREGAAASARLIS